LLRRIYFFDMKLKSGCQATFALALREHSSRHKTLKSVYEWYMKAHENKSTVKPFTLGQKEQLGFDRPKRLPAFQLRHFCFSRVVREREMIKLWRRSVWKCGGWHEMLSYTNANNVYLRIGSSQLTPALLTTVSFSTIPGVKTWWSGLQKTLEKCHFSVEKTTTAKYRTNLH